MEKNQHFEEHAKGKQLLKVSLDSSDSKSAY